MEIYKNEIIVNKSTTNGVGGGVLTFKTKLNQEFICDARIERADDDRGFRIFIACKMFNKKIIELFEYTGQEVKTPYSMTYKYAYDKPPQIKISKGMKCALLVNHKENYLFEILTKDKTSMKKLPVATQEQNDVRYILPDEEGGFFVFISDEYDQHFSIVHTKNNENKDK